MRRDRFGTGWWSMTVLLIATNVVAYLMQLVLIQASPKLEGYFALSVAGLARGYVWQLLTFQFMHGGFLHLLFNCFAIFMFGREVEQSLGRRSFLTLYLSSGVLGGLFQVAFVKLLALSLQNSSFEGVQVVGASAGAFGLIAAFATLYPERPLMLLLFFIIPVNMRAKFLLLFEGVVALFGIAMTARQFNLPGSQVAHAAHLGGMLTGILFIRYAIHWEWPQFKRPKGRRIQRLVKVPAASAGWRQKRAGSPDDLPPEEFLSKEVDPILDKISAQGIQSLTERERRILQAAREKMAKR